MNVQSFEILYETMFSVFSYCYSFRVSENHRLSSSYLQAAASSKQIFFVECKCLFSRLVKKLSFRATALCHIPLNSETKSRLQSTLNIIRDIF